MSNRRPRPVLASFVAALAMILPIAVMCFVEINSDPVVLPSGEVDDAGMRGAGVALLALPFIYMICVVLCHVSGYFLLRFGFRRLRHFVIFALAVSAVLGVMAGLNMGRSPKIELTNIAATFLLVAVVLGVIGSIGAAIWWWLAVKPYNLSLNRDGESAAAL